MLGILLIDKPSGCTSHDVVDEVRRRFHTRRVGHAGTLDPLATGLLIVAVGPATRFLQYLPLEPKEYVAEITFGKATVSYDAESEATGTGEVPADLGFRIQQILPEFKGLIQQIPPMFSAVKVNGKPLYRYAREGAEVARDPRSVHVAEIDLQRVEADRVTARIVCSGGTYIRTLAHDIGQAVGCGAYLSALNRTRVGRFQLEDATRLDDLHPERMMPLAEALLPMPMVGLSVQQVENVREGRQVGIPDLIEGPLAALVEPGQGVFSVARVHGNLLQPECVIPIEAMHGALRTSH